MQISVVQIRSYIAPFKEPVKLTERFIRLIKPFSPVLRGA